jgi:hypothetical protein
VWNSLGRGNYTMIPGENTSGPHWVTLRKRYLYPLRGRYSRWFERDYFQYFTAGCAVFSGRRSRSSTFITTSEKDGYLFFSHSGVSVAAGVA